MRLSSGAAQVLLAKHRDTRGAGDVSAVDADVQQWEVKPLGEFLFKGKGMQHVWRVSDSTTLACNQEQPDDVRFHPHNPAPLPRLSPPL